MARWSAQRSASPAGEPPALWVEAPNILPEARDPNGGSMRPPAPTGSACSRPARRVVRRDSYAALTFGVHCALRPSKGGQQSDAQTVEQNPGGSCRRWRSRRWRCRARERGDLELELSLGCGVVRDASPAWQGGARRRQDPRDERTLPRNDRQQQFGDRDSRDVPAQRAATGLTVVQLPADVRVPAGGSSAVSALVVKHHVGGDPIAGAMQRRDRPSRLRCWSTARSPGMVLIGSGRTN